MAQKTIFYDDYVRTKSVFESDDKNLSFTDLLSLSVLNNCDIITARYCVEIIPIYNNYEHYIIKDCDIVSDISFSKHLDMKPSLMIGCNEYDIKDIKEILLLCIINPVKIKFNFKNFQNNEKITLNYKKHLCRTDIREQLMNSEIITKNFIYKNGDVNFRK